MKKQSFLEGAFVLTIAGFINRLLGFFLRILLVKTIGDEGLGLFQMVYPFYMTLLLLSTSGFPMAISKLIPEKLSQDNTNEAFNLLKVTIIYVTIMGSLIGLFLFFSADFIAEHIYSDERIYFTLICIIPALILCPLASSLRGFFQGFHTMIPTAISQVTEQINRIIATIILINMVSYLGLQYQSASIAIGICVGELTGFLILIYFFIKDFNSYEQTSIPNITETFISKIKEISKIAVPVTVGRIINSLMTSGEAVLIPRQLKISGKTITEATSLYGQLSGMVMQVIFLPTVITIALTTSLIPNVSRDYSNDNIQKIKSNYQDIIRITTYLGLPITIIYYMHGRAICNFLFSFPEAGDILSILAFSSTFIYFMQVSSGMLKGLGRPFLSLRNMALGSIIKLFGIYFLVQSYLGITGAAIAITSGFIISAFLNFISIGNILGFDLNLNQTILKPLCCSSLLFAINPYLSKFLNKVTHQNFYLKTSALLLLLIIIYLTTMYLLGAITSKDIERFKS